MLKWIKTFFTAETCQYCRSHKGNPDDFDFQEHVNMCREQIFGRKRPQNVNDIWVSGYLEEPPPSPEIPQTRR